MRRLALALLMTLAAIASVPAATPPALPEGVTAEPDLVYATRGDQKLMLDFYRPTGATTPLPVVIWIHGGGWTGGTRARIVSPARLLPHGFAIASISYRFAPKLPAAGAVFPAQIEDCRSAVRWLRAQAPRLGIDPKRIGAWGLSAGGHLAALLGTSAARKEWDVGEHLDQSSEVQAVCDWFGVTQFIAPEGQDTAAEGSRKDAMANLLGGAPASVVELARAANPLTHIAAGCPPFLIMHGADDTTVLPYHSRNLHEALKAAGADSTYHLVPGQKHAMSDAQYPPVVDFFVRTLKAGR